MFFWLNSIVVVLLNRNIGIVFGKRDLGIHSLFFGLDNGKLEIRKARTERTITQTHIVATRAQAVVMLVLLLPSSLSSGILAHDFSSFQHWTHLFPWKLNFC